MPARDCQRLIRNFDHQDRGFSRLDENMPSGFEDVVRSSIVLSILGAVPKPAKRDE